MKNGKLTEDELNEQYNIKIDKPDPKLSAKEIEKRAAVALKALERTNKGKDAEVAIR